MYVDITSPDYGPVTCVEFFHGYGGNALGLKRAIPGLRSIAVCERDAFVVANMVSKMEKGLLDAVPIWTDVTDFPTRPFGCGLLDLFVASYPCQGFSNAGKRLGVDDHRHLWPYCRKFIGAVRPGWVWLENVEGHVSLGLSAVLSDLAEDGYTAAWGIFSASEVGAPHQRKRVFILAYDRSNGHLGRAIQDGVEGRGVQEQTRQRPGISVVRSEATGCGECANREELALRDSLGCSHGEPEIQPAERGVNALGNAGTGCREDVAHQQQQGLEGHARDEYGEGREPGGTDRPVAEGGVLAGEGVPNTRSAHAEGITPHDQNQERTAEHRTESGGICEHGTVWPSRPGASQYGWEPPRVVGKPADEGQSFRRGGEVGGQRTPESQLERPDSQQDGTERQTQPPLGGNADGTPPGLDVPGCTGFSNTELAEVGLTLDEAREVESWLTRFTNRTDELRLSGNGVVPQTAERAFRVLYAELTGHSGTNDLVLEDI